MHSSPFRPIDKAACDGDILEVLRLIGQGSIWNIWTSACAAFCGHPDLLRWARSQGFPLDVHTCSNATPGQLDALRYWGEVTCANAADAGHLHLLQWAVGQGCPLSQWVFSIAAEAENIEMLHWARSRGCPCFPRDIMRLDISVPEKLALWRCGEGVMDEFGIAGRTKMPDELVRARVLLARCAETIRRLRAAVAIQRWWRRKISDPHTAFGHACVSRMLAARCSALV